MGYFFGRFEALLGGFEGLWDFNGSISAILEARFSSELNWICERPSIFNETPSSTPSQEAKGNFKKPPKTQRSWETQKLYKAFWETHNPFESILQDEHEDEDDDDGDRDGDDDGAADDDDDGLEEGLMIVF